MPVKIHSTRHEKPAQRKTIKEINQMSAPSITIAAATKISPIPGPIWLLASKENKEQKAPITNTNIPAAAGNNAPNKLHKKFILLSLALLFFVGPKMLIHKGKRNQYHGNP